jgi:membrane protein DedA with SNARE-associated domain
MADFWAPLMHSPWTPLLLAFLGPFVQEDAAVLGAATAAATGAGDAAGLFIATFLGLLVSDGWKYWIGYYAHANRWAREKADHPKVMAARDQVLGNLWIALLTARFVPGTRIPLYVACGYFKAPFWRFLIMIAATGLMYLTIAFVAIAALGAAVGEHLPLALGAIVGVAVLALIFYYWRKRRRMAG